MADSTLNKFIAAGTAADRVAFTPSPPTPASGAAQGYFWHETDTGDTYSWKAGTGWIKVNSSGAVTSLSTAISTVDSNQSSSISVDLSKITSLSTAVSTVDSNESTSLSQISSSLSGAISSTTSLSSAVSTVDGNQSTSLSQISSSLSSEISTDLSRINSLSTAVGSGGVSRLFSAFSAVGTSTVTTEQDLITYTLPGGTLASDGQAVRIRVRGQYANVARSRQLRLYFGATDIGFFSSAAGSAFNIDIDAIVIRSGAATQRATANVIGAVNNTTTATAIFQSQTTPGETLSGSVIIKVTGQAAATAVANDVVCDLVSVELLP